VTAEIVLATGHHARARPLWEKRVVSESLNLDVVSFQNDGARHQRFLKGEFDAAEFSLALYLALKSRGAPISAIPVFPNRRFRHAFIYVREDSEFDDPKQIRGKTIGVPNYLNTCGLWVRGLLGDEYGITPQDAAWKAVRKEPVEIVLPSGIRVEWLEGKKDLSELLLSRSIDAAVTPDMLDVQGIGRLISSPKLIEKDYYRRTGVHPVSHAVVIRNAVVEKFPWLGQELFNCWVLAKKLSLEDDADPTYSNFAWIRELWEEERAVFGPDPWPYGLTKNEAVLSALLRYAAEQGITDRLMDAQSVFYSMDEI